MSYALRTAALVAATAVTTAIFATLSSCAHAAPARVYTMPNLDAPAEPHEPEDALPNLHPERWCKRLRGFSPQDMYAPSAQEVAVCIKMEQGSYDRLHDLWPLLTERGKHYCTTGLGKTPTDNYALLEACAVGQLRKEENERNANGSEPRFERW